MDSRSCIAGNEAADKLAKNGSKKEQPQPPISYNDFSKLPIQKQMEPLTTKVTSTKSKMTISMTISTN